MAQHGQTTLCCQTAPPDLLQTEADAFDCGRCERRRLLAALDDDNRDAWALWGVLASRIAVDYGLGRTVFERAVEGMALDDVADLLDRLAVLYDVLRPLTPPPSL